jgi:hypothetical protein
MASANSSGNGTARSGKSSPPKATKLKPLPAHQAKMVEDLFSEDREKVLAALETAEKEDPRIRVTAHIAVAQGCPIRELQAQSLVRLGALVNEHREFLALVLPVFASFYGMAVPPEIASAVSKGLSTIDPHSGSDPDCLTPEQLANYGTYYPPYAMPPGRGRRGKGSAAAAGLDADEATATPNSPARRSNKVSRRTPRATTGNGRARTGSKARSDLGKWSPGSGSAPQNHE